MQKLPSHLRQIGVGAKFDPSKVRAFCGEGYDRRTAVVVFPEVDGFYKASYANTWSPSEIGMGDDKTQWNSDTSLTQAERYMFELGVSYLTCSDSIVPDNINAALMGAASSYEVAQYLRRQSAEEENHLRSYRYILESFGLDTTGQAQVFELYQDTPALIKKLDWSIQFTRNMDEMADAYGEVEYKRALLENLIAYYLFEHMFFPLGFSQVFALSRFGKLPNTARQYRYILRDETLHAANGLWMIRQLIQENPGLFDAGMRESARDIIAEAVALEIEYAKATLPDGGVQGLTLREQVAYAQFMGNIAAIGIGVPMLSSQTDHPLPWMAEFELVNNGNFFETRVTEYQVGAQLKWD
jgi:ribonucleoside-diphosphate reductase beta chain